jgi:predicted ABC-type ATPase
MRPALLLVAGPNGAGKTTEIPQWVADAIQGLEKHADFVDARAA